MAGKIYRRKKSSEFVTLDTHCSRNKKLRWAPKGLHTYLFQLPEDWKINIADLENRSEDGRDATTSAMNALMGAGYVIRERKHDDKGRFEGYDYFVFERPEHAIEWLTENGKAVNGSPVNGKTATSKVLKPLSEVSKNEWEGERTPPAPNPSNVKEEKNESPKVAPKGSLKSCPVSCTPADYCAGGKCDLNGCFIPTVKAEITPSPNSAAPPSPFNMGFCGNCMGLGYRNGRNGRETCEDCDGSGNGDKMIDSKQFEVTAIALPTDLPSVTLVEAAPKPIQPWERPLPGSPKELKNALLRYSEENPDNWRDNVLESGRATGMAKEKIDEYLTDFCAWQFQQDSTKGKLSQYTAGFSLWLKRQPRFEAMNTTKEGRPTRNGKANINHWGANPGGYEEKQAF